MFLKPKPLAQQAEEKRAKVQIKQLDLQSKQIDRQIMGEKRRRIEEAQIPPRLRA